MYVAPEVGPEIYVGSFIAVLPIVWGALEFYKRIKTQQECLLCTGSGLVYVTPSGSKLTRPRKCYNCGGFIPWLGWKMVRGENRAENSDDANINTLPTRIPQDLLIMHILSTVPILFVVLLFNLFRCR